jgi:hypothetical protein
MDPCWDHLKEKRKDFRHIQEEGVEKLAVLQVFPQEEFSHTSAIYVAHIFSLVCIIQSAFGLRNAQWDALKS